MSPAYPVYTIQPCQERKTAMSEPVIQNEYSVENGVFVRDVYGLSIFRVNRVDLGGEPSPFHLLFRELMAQHACAAHTGSVSAVGFADDPWTVFQNLNSDGPLVPTRVGLWGGQFYALTPEEGPACLFPVITQPSFGLSQEDFEYLLLFDFFALYLGVTDATRARLVSAATDDDKPAETWLDTALDNCGAVVTTEADGIYLRICSRREDDLRLMDKAIAAVATYIESNDWFKEHRERLEWDAELELCLRLP
jgi:hypothetical protein